MPMHLPFTPNHVQLISACYPPNAALLTAGPDYRPNSQELSRMTYYASNRPGKINKLASELEKRVRLDSRKAKAGNIRARSSLLITLATIKALATECRRDLPLLTASLLASVNLALTTLSNDLEVAARAGSVFTAWTTYTDGHLIGVDQSITQDYMSCLQAFTTLGRFGSQDQEVMNRTRLIGLAALTGVVTSEALYHSTQQLKAQVSIFMVALIAPLLLVEVSALDHEVSEVKTQPNSPYLSDFRNRPTMERRATSIHLHVTGQTGPSHRDVANAAMRALSALFEHSNGSQAGVSIQAAIDSLSEIDAWDKPEHCRWFAVRAAEWTQYQYRYGIPTRLVECLVQDQDAPQTTGRHSTLAAMITAVFTSPIPLVNLSTSDIISSLISVILRRVAKDPDDALLPALVETIASLGTHVYYTDQIQDLAGELISRLIVVETNGVLVNGKSDLGRVRAQAVRCLLAGLHSLIHAAEMHDIAKEDGDDGKTVHRAALAESGVTINVEAEGRTPRPDGHVRPSRRSNVSPEVWQDTLSLLCDADYSVRADYSSTLVSYLEREILKLWDCTDVDGVKRIRAIAEGPTRQASINHSVIFGDSTTRLLNALHAHLYVLATSTNLGVATRSHTPSSQRSVNGDTTTDDAKSQGDDTEENAPSRRSIGIPRSRKMSVMQRLLRNIPSKLSSFANVSATLSDYGNMLAILKAVQMNLPIRGLVTGVPMLLALDSALQGETSTDTASVQRVQAIRDVLAQTWLAIGKVWECPGVVEIAQNVRALSSPWVAMWLIFVQAIPENFSSRLPTLPEPSPGTFHTPQEPSAFAFAAAAADDSVRALDCEGLLLALVSCETVQEATSLDRQSLLRKLTASWSAESAFKDETQPPSASPPSSDGLSPLVKVLPALMPLENLSRASLARSTRGVGITDLREALEGRSSLSNTNLRETAPSLSTLEHASTAHGEMHKLAPVRSRASQQRSRFAGPGEVKDVLNKLGIGKVNTGGMLKPSFTSKKAETR
ncbi:uncharacterized protein PHACADRAFT_181156 [Phanerochaete carnosa HHB-10118-sp]|uniref:Protein EFR3 n=1 Tax=Phanerochaete carnosa (strain HHB-10118-sp) TaxID=650164 RepID=K5X8F1_PHACS|nr:uncharacterized protein PHACADRAFT_181156 [Phanerochaete carnosa HHB-10118-sp]EKM59162.1 hypothetical protein PHACADRAFT_181156 [Phanerochaete carnosa HHB-10118-sp]